MEPESSSLAETLPADPAADQEWALPGDNEPGWVDVRCCGVMDRQLCNKLLLRITAAPTFDGIKRAVKIGLDMKCRRCKEINYRVIVI